MRQDKAKRVAKSRGTQRQHGGARPPDRQPSTSRATGLFLTTRAQPREAFVGSYKVNAVIIGSQQKHTRARARGGKELEGCRKGWPGLASVRAKPPAGACADACGQTKVAISLGRTSAVGRTRTSGCLPEPPAPFRRCSTVPCSVWHGAGVDSSLPFSRNPRE